MISEVLVYVSAVCYFVFGFPLYGNPNSLGAVMGVVCAPFLLWSVLTTEKPLVRRRRTFTLLLCLLLLFFSQARAGMLAGVVTCALCCLALRRYRILIQGSVFAVLLAVLAVILTPPDTGLDGMPVQHEGASFASYFLYKGQDASGVLGSRASPWQETATVIKEHPWFGSGFGTSPVWDMPEIQVGKYNSTSMTTREHGSSYLAIAEWVGLLGVMPFVLLLVLLVWHLSRILLWVTRTQNARHFCVPVSLARFQHFQTFLVGALFKHFNFNPPCAPLIHRPTRSDVQINGVSANQGWTVVVDDVGRIGVHNSKFRANRVVRPIRRRTVDAARLQARSDCVFYTVNSMPGLRIGVSSGFDNLLFVGSIITWSLRRFAFLRVHSAALKEKYEPE